MKEEISEVVSFELDDPRLETVTVTDVNIAPDLREAKVYVLVRGSEGEVGQALASLRRAAPYVRQQVAVNLDLRFAPHIHFVRDTAEENAARVGELLDELKAKGEFANKENGDE